MTRIKRTKPATKAARRKGSHRSTRSDHWLLQDAKARFSELVRRVKSEGPQHVSLRGREEVVVISAEEFRRLKGRPTGKALVELMRNSPLGDVDIEPERVRLPVRDVDL